MSMTDPIADLSGANSQRDRRHGTTRPRPGVANEDGDREDPQGRGLHRRLHDGPMKARRERSTCSSS